MLALNGHGLNDAVQVVSEGEVLHVQREGFQLDLGQLRDLLNDGDKEQATGVGQLHDTGDHGILGVRYHQVLVGAHDGHKRRPQVMCHRLEIHVLEPITLFGFLEQFDLGNVAHGDKGEALVNT